ncbi:hypothetical protein LCGC14_1631870, partial [marine sediment metagenome]
MPNRYDIAVLGATAAGYVSALTLAAKRRSVIVLDVPGSATESPLGDWVPADVFKACPALRNVRSAGTDAPFRTIRFHDAQLRSEAAFRSRGTVGFVFRWRRMQAALDSAARSKGVQRLRPRAPLALDLRESDVALRVGKRTIHAALLLIAQDGPAEVLTRLRLPARSVPAGTMTLCGLDAQCPRGAAQRSLQGELHVVALDKGSRFGMFFAAGSVLHVRIVSGQAHAPTGPEELAGLIARAQAAGILPERLSLAKARGAIWRPPGGVALELETHLAKRTLLVGSAGGFASALTGQTFDPTVRSAMVAADVAHKALRAKHPQ